MGSRLRVNPLHIFECWCEVVAPQGSNHPPWIIQKFPRTYDEKENLKSIPHFTFPCSFEKCSVQHFSFVLTNVESKFLYGFCRHAPESESALVILSHLPWHELFYKILNNCSTLINGSSAEDLWAFLQSLYKSPLPHPGTNITIKYCTDKVFTSSCPNHITLPSIPENRNLSEYFSAVDTKNMMIIFASLLNERRVIVTSEKVSRLSACVQAANALIYPMTWQHIFIPVLPEHLLDYLSAPMPFLIGVAQPLFQKVKQDDVGEVVILDADINKVSTPFSDLEDLPPEVVSSLKKSLSPPNNLLGDAVPRAFMRALVHLIGNYREALLFRDDDRRISFSHEKFLTLRPAHFQPFITSLLQQQLFRQFVDERLNLLNSGLHTSDEFELEASVFGERSPSKVKQLISNVKRESGAIMKNVKSKTNPAVKSAVKSVSKSSKNVREKSRTTYKELRTKIKDAHHKNNSSLLRNNQGSLKKQLSVPSSPTQPNKFPENRPTTVLNLGPSQAKLRQSLSRPFSSEIDSASHRDHKWEFLVEDSDGKTPSPEELDLMGEMENVLKGQIINPNRISSTSDLFSGISFNCRNSSSVKNKSSPDLLLMESPSDEVEIEFDPLLAKNIPKKVDHNIGNFDWSSSNKLNNSGSKSNSSGSRSDFTGSHLDISGSKSDVSGSTSSVPGRLLPDRYFPFTTVRSTNFSGNSLFKLSDTADLFNPSYTAGSFNPSHTAGSFNPSHTAGSFNPSHTAGSFNVSSTTTGSFHSIDAAGSYNLSNTAGSCRTFDAAGSVNPAGSFNLSNTAGSKDNSIIHNSLSNQSNFVSTFPSNMNNVRKENGKSISVNSSTSLSNGNLSTSKLSKDSDNCNVNLLGDFTSDFSKLSVVKNRDS